MFKLRRFLSGFIRSTDTKGDIQTYDEIFKDLLEDTEYGQYVYDNIVYTLCVRDFKIPPAWIIDFFKSEAFDVDDFYVIAFYLGSILQKIQDNPKLFLEHALHNLKESFTPEELAKIQYSLDAYNESYNNNLKTQYESLTNKEMGVEESSAKLSDDDWANDLIEKWMKNKNKNVNIRDKKQNDQ